MQAMEPGPSALKKLSPKAKLPASEILKQLSIEDQRVLARRLAEPAECVYDPRFRRADAEARFMGPAPSGPKAGGPNPVDASDDSGIDLLALPETTDRKDIDEPHVFGRFNYCRYRVMRVLSQFRGAELTGEATTELLRWERLSTQTRDLIVRINVPLVLAMAKRTRITGVDYADLISEGNLALMRSVDKFDCARGYKFSTYACRAILKSFSRVATRTARYRGLFPAEFDPTLEKSDAMGTKRQGVEEDCVDELRAILGKNLAELNDVEQQVLRARFALDEADADPAQRAKTLEQVGEMIGVTKERVRQIQNRALGKLRTALEDGVLRQG